jgi:hypothetical protein
MLLNHGRPLPIGSLAVARHPARIFHAGFTPTSRAHQLRLLMSADRGYYSGAEILDCETLHITTCIPKIHTSGSCKKNLFSKRDLKWIAKD